MSIDHSTHSSNSDGFAESAALAKKPPLTRERYSPSLSQHNTGLSFDHCDESSLKQHQLSGSGSLVFVNGDLDWGEWSDTRTAELAMAASNDLGEHQTSALIIQTNF